MFFQTRITHIMQIILFVLSLLVIKSYGSEICCEDIGCFNNKGIFHVFALPQCPQTLNISFNLYTRTNRNKPVKLSTENGTLQLDDESHFDAQRMTIITTHGWFGDANLEWMKTQKNVIIQKMDANVFMIGWARGSKNANYYVAASTTRTVGAHIARVVDWLVERYGVSYDNVWCIGFSLGGHVCGHMGMRTAKKIGRITGLDPAGLLFEKQDLLIGLNPTSAQYVDVIHTDGSGVIYGGTLKQYGHADFYPNKGEHQPKCVLYRKRSGRKIDLWPNGMSAKHSNTSVKEHGLQTFGLLAQACSHYRARMLFEETFNIHPHCHRAAYKCDDNNNIPESCSRCQNNECAILGLENIKNKPHGMFFLETSEEAPFCMFGKLDRYAPDF